MSFVRPTMYTDVTDIELQGERPVSEETIRKLIYNVNMMRALAPIGEIIGMHINLVGVKLPFSNVWQYCDGGRISEPTSPLSSPGSQFVPNLIGKYIRGGYNSGTLGGAASINLTHGHSIGAVGNNPGNLLQAGDNVRAFEPYHTHDMPADLGVTTLDPAHMEIVYYFKVT